jgi:hypothetical protein
MGKIKLLWSRVQHCVHSHEKAFHRTHSVTHLSYFAMVATHSAYHWAAAALLILGIIGWVLHLGEEV